MNLKQLPPIISQARLALATDTSLSTIKRRIKEGKFKAYRDGRSVKVDTASVIAFYESLPPANDLGAAKSS